MAPPPGELSSGMPSGWLREFLHAEADAQRLPFFDIKIFILK
jgi:hypothetical protein